ncbi:MAG: Ig-like domain-containing protein, partial [Acidimicrobiia bacterium]|nr:Ig-like domain-containing protein [Acidimicrobiia bacterium]
MRQRSSRFHLRRIVASAAALMWLAVLATPVAAGNSPLGDAAAPWPSSWDSYGYTNGSPVVDIGDNNPGYSDLWGGSADNLPTVFFSSDGTNAFFRVRVRDDPASKNGGFNSTSWLVSIAVGGTQAAVVGLNGKPSATDYVYTSNADGSVTPQIYATPFTNDGSGTSAGARAVTAPDEGFFIDFQVPIAQITSVAPSVTGSTPVQLFFGTSQAANLSVINKDFMAGGAVSYVGLATVRLDGEDPGPANSPPAAADDSTTTAEDTTVVVPVLANDTDSDGDPLTVFAFDPSSLNGGAVSCTPSGDCIYSPPSDFSGTDSYTYTVADGNGGSD